MICCGAGRARKRGLPITEPVKTKRIEMVDEIKRAIEIAEEIPFRYMVQHLGGTHEEYDERRRDAAFSSLEETESVRQTARRGDNSGEHSQRISTGAMLSQFLDETHLKLGLCLDVGHANLMEGVETAYGTMKERIRSTHLHDNDGKLDKHLFRLSTMAGRSIGRR